MLVFYENKKGNMVKVSLTIHSIKRFKERFEKLYEKTITIKEAKEQLKKVWYSKELKKEIEGKHLKKRRKKRKKAGATTIYFYSDLWRFVVCNGSLVTVEIRGKLKELNNVAKIWNNKNYR